MESQDKSTFISYHCNPDNINYVTLMHQNQFISSVDILCNRVIYTRNWYHKSANNEDVTMQLLSVNSHNNDSY